jgi:amidophosphoribosyltransferase
MCGIAGAIGVDAASAAIRTMLHALQNRGQQAAGIVSINGTKKHEHRSYGAVTDFPQEELDRLMGNIAIGHNRYATAANSDGPKNMQPFLMTIGGEPIAIAHNGNFTNIPDIEETELKGTPFVSESDTERFFRLLLRTHRTESLENSIVATLEKMRGSCSAVLALPGRLIAVRDSSGNRPLFWGRLGNGFVVASETSGLDAVGVFTWQEVSPGTIVTFCDDGELYISGPFGDDMRRYCPFELVYFGQITSTLYGIPVTNIREEFGRELAREHPVQADIILGIPDSGTLSASGYGELHTSGVFKPHAIIRRHNTGRTFIKSGQRKREQGVSEKFGFTSSEIVGKRVIVVDDSLVRGTTSRRITEELRARGASEVHWRISSPPVTGPCHYGIATRTGELLAADHSIAEMCVDIGADSLQFLSLQGFKRVIARYGVNPDDCCFACMDGNYWHLI